VVFSVCFFSFDFYPRLRSRFLPGSLENRGWLGFPAIRADLCFFLGGGGAELNLRVGAPLGLLCGFPQKITCPPSRFPGSSSFLLPCGFLCPLGGHAVSQRGVGPNVDLILSCARCLVFGCDIQPSRIFAFSCPCRIGVLFLASGLYPDQACWSRFWP